MAGERMIKMNLIRRFAVRQSSSPIGLTSYRNSLRRPFGLLTSCSTSSSDSVVLSRICSTAIATSNTRNSLLFEMSFDYRYCYCSAKRCQNIINECADNDAFEESFNENFLIRELIILIREGFYVVVRLHRL